MCKTLGKKAWEAQKGIISGPVALSWLTFCNTCGIIEKGGKA